MLAAADCLCQSPFRLPACQPHFVSLLPNPPLTLDQLKLLKVDNVCQKSALGLTELGIMPTAIESVVPDYLMQFRPGGRFAPAVLLNRSADDTRHNQAKQ